MVKTDLADRLAEHRVLGSVPREELEWLAEHGSIRHLAAGDILSGLGEKINELFVLLVGSVVVSIDRGSGPQKLIEWRAGDVLGLLPYSRLVAPPGIAVAQEPSEILSLGRQDIRELIVSCHEITTRLVHSMLDRARNFTSTELHNEKMISLGKLSAGLAHELNNPVAAIARAAASLEGRLNNSETASRVLGGSELTELQLVKVNAARDTCMTTRPPGVLSPIQTMEREEAFEDWLANHRLDTSLAEVLADSAVSLEALDTLAAAIEGPALLSALRWVAAGCAVREIASEIQEASARIADLVTAVKGFTNMDRASIAEPVDLVKGIGDTVAVLRAKALAKSISVVVETEPGLPPVRGFAGELNQIWANLIDNAIDAVPASGRIGVLAGREGNRVAVRVIDNGEGIPLEVQPRIFDPFFTTKPVGQGTGLGLDIVRRLVRHNNGVISVQSQPGQTEFQVLLPLAEIESEGPRP